jgi:hypothetical protein
MMTRAARETRRSDGRPPSRASVTSMPVGFWLVPSAPHHRRLAAVIDGLAREVDGPRFEPHVTVYAGERTAGDDVGRLLTEAAEMVGAMVLRVAGVGTSPDLFKTLYLELEPDAGIERLCGHFRAGLTHAGDYVLRPHLSLLYKRLNRVTRTALARRFDWVGDRITFDHIAAVGPGPDRSDWLDIDHWDVWLRRRLKPRRAGMRTIRGMWGHHHRRDNTGGGGR